MKPKVTLVVGNVLRILFVLLQHNSVGSEVDYLIADTPCGHSATVTAKQMDHRNPEKVSLPAFCFHAGKH